MTLTYGFNTIRDLHAKLRRDAAALDEEVTSDRLFNFVITGYSMIDWVKNDSTVPEAAKQDLALEGLYSNRWLKVCGDLATASKHYKITRRTSVITAEAKTSKGFGMGRYGKGGFGAGEESIDIELNDGDKFHCLDLVNGVSETWDSFFSEHGI